VSPAVDLGATSQPAGFGTAGFSARPGTRAARAPAPCTVATATPSPSTTSPATRSPRTT